MITEAGSQQSEWAVTIIYTSESTLQFHFSGN